MRPTEVRAVSLTFMANVGDGMVVYGVAPDLYFWHDQVSGDASYDFYLSANEAAEAARKHVLTNETSTLLRQGE